MSKKAWLGRGVCFAAYAATISGAFVKCNSVVPAPYMDEIFHVGQAQTYTRTWTQYDEKLTTPPGLYIPSALFARYLTPWAASLPGLRSVNALLLFCLPYLIDDLLTLVRNPMPHSLRKHRLPRHEALSICTFPLVYFFGFLYYTDIASLVLVLLAYRQALLASYTISAFVGLLSLSVRQTNILWIAYIAFEALYFECDGLNKTMQTKQFRDRNRLSGLSLPDISRELASLVYTAASNPLRIMHIVLPYTLVATCFGIFVAWNGGIVLGDKAMHVAVLHIPQILYFAAFASTMLLPFVCNPRVVRTTFSMLVGSGRRLLASVCTSLLLALFVYKFTVVHPFLLADNRHYPFYIWRRLINFSRYSRYALSPGYLTAGAALWRLISLSGTWGILPVLAYCAVTCLTLIPSPLLEFRYFIIPYIILRLHVRPWNAWQIAFESAFNISVNLVTLAVFWYSPFRWPSEPGLQRFMW